jgi:hypothetical protein
VKTVVRSKAQQRQCKRAKGLALDGAQDREQHKMAGRYSRSPLLVPVNLLLAIRNVFSPRY